MGWLAGNQQMSQLLASAVWVSSSPRALVQILAGSQPSFGECSAGGSGM